MLPRIILWIDGRYGDYFEIDIDDQRIKVDGNHYTLDGKELTSAQWTGLKLFMKQFTKVSDKEPFEPSQYGSKYKIQFKGKPLSMVDGVLVNNDGTEFLYTDRKRLYFLAMNILDERGDFYLKRVN